jgi:hypothetical protein
MAAGGHDVIELDPPPFLQVFGVPSKDVHSCLGHDLDRIKVQVMRFDFCLSGSEKPKPFISRAL